jgi:hypothetical protein
MSLLGKKGRLRWGINLKIQRRGAEEAEHAEKARQGKQQGLIQHNLGGIKMRTTRSIGLLLLAIWLILQGLIPLLHFSFAGLSVVMAILAIAAGILILLGR